MSYNMYNATNHFYPRSPCGERPDRHVQPPTQPKISIHALLAESDRINARYTKRAEAFLSTLSLRRATLLSLPSRAVWIDFYPRSPCGERLDKRCEFHRNNRNFYPRSPCGERLHNLNLPSKPIDISIHALLAESDQTQSLKIPTHSNFYPRSPCGERLTFNPPVEPVKVSISIHALLAESDLKTPCVKLSIDVFLSTLSLRRAT